MKFSPRRHTFSWVIVLCCCSAISPLYAQSPDDLTHRYARLTNPSWTDAANDLRAMLKRQGKMQPLAARALADSLTAEIDAHPRRPYHNLLRHLYAGQCLRFYTDSDRVFHHYRTAVQITEGLAPDNPARALACHILGQYLVEESVYDLGLEYLEGALAVVRANFSPLESGSLDYPIQIAAMRAYSETGNADSTYACFRRVITVDTLRSVPDRIGHAYNNAGAFLQRAGDCHRARTVFDKGLTYPVGSAKHDQLSYVNLLESRAHCLMQDGQFDRAMEDLDRAFRVRREFGRHDWASQALGYQIFYHQERGHPERALALYREHEDYLNGPWNAVVHHQNWRLEYRLAQLLYYFGEDDRARYHENRYFRYAAEHPEADLHLVDRRRPINAFLALRNREFEQREEIARLELKSLSGDVRRRNLLLGLIASLLVLLVVVGVSFYRRRRERFQAELATRSAQERILGLENENLRLSVIAKEKDLSRLATDNQARTAVKRDVLRRLDTLVELAPREREREILRLRQELGVAVDDQQALSTLQTNLEEVNARFEQSLRERVPGITPQEVRICGLVRLGMDDRQIANLLQKSETAVRTMRYRIRKKAGWEAKEMYQVLGEL